MEEVRDPGYHFPAAACTHPLRRMYGCRTLPRVGEPAKLVQSPYLETQADVDGSLDMLGTEIEQAIANEERMEIR
jgi:hypothetical protein